MEAMFLDYLMKVMRDTVPSSEYSMDSSATKIYRSMMDSEFSQTAARNGGVGLADQIIASLVPNSYNQREPSGTEPAPGSRTGGSK
jgi:flagellar protein FlgJ